MAAIGNPLKQPVSDLPLALWRSVLGVLVLVVVLLDWGNIGSQLVKPAFHFTYDGFGWVKPLPLGAMQGIYIVLGLAALGLVVGFASRPMAAICGLALAYILLIDQARYASNVYLLILSCFLLALLPRVRSLSLDSKLFGAGQPATVPTWAQLAVMILAGVPLLYAGLYRLTPDWLQGWPLRYWFANAAPRHWLGPQASELLASKTFAIGWAWFVCGVHLAAIPLLLWLRTLWVAFAALVVVFVGYSLIFKTVIAPFPLFAALLVFIPAESYRKAWRLLRRTKQDPREEGEAKRLALAGAGRASAVAVGILLGFHGIFPARGIMYPGKDAWSGDGYRFSWRDMLDDRYCENEFVVVDPASQRSYTVPTRVRVAGFQLAELHLRPDMMLQFAHFMDQAYADDMRIVDPKVLLRSKCSLNTRPYSQLVDPQLDLSTVQRTWGATEWIRPPDNRDLPPGWLKPGMKKKVE
jgi:vitamin K-dependent gamma-carboxylase